MTHADLDVLSVTKAYDRWAPIYDLVFGQVFKRGRNAAVLAADRVGGRILEVGVGTGISLPHYARRNRIVGVDISEPMLRQAQQRVDRQRLNNVEQLSIMDAAHLDFPDDAFDVVVAQYVVTAVQDPEATLDEFARVVRPGGEIILLSRIGADSGVRQTIERAVAPVTRRLGWRTEFPWERYVNWARGARDIRLVEKLAMPPLGHFAMVRFTKVRADASQRPTR